MKSDRSRAVIRFGMLCIFLLSSFPFAQDTSKDASRSNWLSSVILKLENLRDQAVADIQKYEGNIQRCDNTISKSDNIVQRAQEKGNSKAETIAREASFNATEAKKKNIELKKSAELNKKRVENILAYVKTGANDIESKVEQDEFERMNAAWMETQKKLIQQRLEGPNQWCSAIYKSLKTKAPPLPFDKKYGELQSGDVLLFEGKAIAKVDNLLSSGDGDKASNAAHTVIYLKEVNGKKLFMDNQPFEGPRIISEDEFLNRYGSRGAQVAKLAQPLDEKEAKQLFTAAVGMAQKNRTEVAKSLLGTGYLGSNYGAWGKEDVVCSEADWALLKAAGRNIPKSGDRIKVGLGIDFSPADFFNNEQYFLVTRLSD
jgi:hypothetical protein